MKSTQVYKSCTFVIAFTIIFSVAWWARKLQMLVGNGAVTFENLNHSETTQASTGAFIDLFHLFHTMNDTANNWTDPDPGHRMIPNFVKRQIATSADDIVLATHADVSKTKLENLMTQVKRWGGPVSAALYIQGEDGINSLNEFLSNITLPPHMSIHVLLELPNRLGYPHNILRNLAMDFLGSDFFLALDVDLLPPKNSHERLMALMSNSDSEIRQEMKEKRLFVLPAFLIHRKKKKKWATLDLIPESKDELLDMVLDERASGFWMRDYPCGYQATQFLEWFNTSSHNGRIFYHTQYETDFEPYVAGYRPGIPKYWPIFRGFGYNKASFFNELHRARYSFAVLGDLYVVHLQHPSNFKMNELSINMDKRKSIFEKYLDEKYPRRSKTKYKCVGEDWSKIMEKMRVRFNHSQTTILDQKHGYST